MRCGTSRITFLPSVSRKFQIPYLQCQQLYASGRFLILHFLISVPNVSFEVYAPGFFSRFLESHAVMFQGNAGLKPKEGEVTSRPWQWPINYKVQNTTASYLKRVNSIFLFCCLFAGAIFLGQFLQGVPIGKSDNLVEQSDIPGIVFDCFFHIIGTRSAEL